MGQNDSLQGSNIAGLPDKLGQATHTSRLSQTGARALASLTVENYVKAIFKICRQDGNKLAATGRLAVALDVSPGTVTSMLKALSDSGLATYTPYEGVQLTESGLTLALEIVRRHRLIESFLAKVLGMSWDEVHEDAEQLEHSVSKRLVERIDEFLGHPEYDPHGDPIPGQDGVLPERSVCSLSECPRDCSFELAQVTDQTPDFLRYLSHSGFVLGCKGTVMANRPEASVITVRVADSEVSLGIDAAQKMLVAATINDETENEAESARDSIRSVPAPHLHTTSIRTPH
jgi:DtxR family Mn-dependent transcriptional regulator